MNLALVFKAVLKMCIVVVSLVEKTDFLWGIRSTAQNGTFTRFLLAIKADIFISLALCLCECVPTKRVIVSSKFLHQARADDLITALLPLLWAHLRL